MNITSFHGQLTIWMAPPPRRLSEWRHFNGIGFKSWFGKYFKLLIRRAVWFSVFNHFAKIFPFVWMVLWTGKFAIRYQGNHSSFRLYVTSRYSSDTGRRYQGTPGHPGDTRRYQKISVIRGEVPGTGESRVIVVIQRGTREFRTKTVWLSAL